jgi:hypothetical protein
LSDVLSVLSVTFALLSIAAGAVQMLAGLPQAPSRDVVATAEPGAVPPASFSAEASAVSNWRTEAMQDLAPLPLSALAVALGAERPVITRCVKLNNYWCIKSARWNGEIGADDEGHTGFASAEHGADAAVRLLRRYYLEFDRKSALDIVRRWAPAECRVAGSSGPPVLLALRGLGNTLRARWLAARRTPPARTKVAAAGDTVPVAKKPAAARVSAVPLRPLPTISMPSIMAGIGAPKPATAPLPASVTRQSTPAPLKGAKATVAQRPVARPAPPVPATATPTAPAARPEPAATASLPAPSCAPDEQRIQNYAARIVLGLDLQPGDDLKLFDEDGRPQPNLARVLLAMSSFELGYLRASVQLVEEAIERAPAPPARQEGPAGPSGPVL